MEITEPDFYRLASEVARQSKTGRFAAKSPALLLPSEQLGEHREIYYGSLLHRLKNQKSRTQYLFSLPHLRSELNKLPKADAEKVLNWWELLLSYKNLEIRFTEDSFNSCIIGDNHILTKEGTKRFLLSPDFSKSADIIRHFDSHFKKASVKHKDMIKELRKSL